jgi:hypothetical protein
MADVKNKGKEEGGNHHEREIDTYLCGHMAVYNSRVAEPF